MSVFNGNKTVNLVFSDGSPTVTLPVYEAQMGPDVIDITGLYKQTGKFTYDPGYMSTASCRSDITYINGEAGQLLYRGYPIDELAQKCDFLEVCHLLLKGELPNAEEKADFDYLVMHHTMVHEQLQFLLRTFRRDADPMAVLHGMVGAMSAFYPQSANLLDPQQRAMAAIQMIGKMPTLVAMVHKYSVGEPFVWPKNGLNYASNFMRMMFSIPCEEYVNNPVLDRAIDRIFILHADHEQNASTSTIRLCVSSGTSPFAAIASGVACLWGPQHGGANVAALQMLQDLLASGGQEKVGEFFEDIKTHHDAQHRLIGFGHRVYKNYDPRARLLRQTCHEVLDTLGLHDDPLFKLAMTVERIALEDDYFVSRKLYPNVDFYSGIVLKALGIPKSLFTAIFALARTVGWFAQMNEMINDPSCRLSRPRQFYTGSKLRHVADRLDR